MSGITGAIVVGGSALAGTVAGGLIAKSGAEAAGQSAADATVEAAKIQAQSTDKSIAAQQQMTDKAANVLREQYGIARQDLLPFQQIQLKALQDAAGLTDPNSQIYQDERRLSTESIQRQLSAQGLLRSKNQVDLLSNLEVGLNSERFNRVNQLAGIGAAQQGGSVIPRLGWILIRPVWQFRAKYRFNLSEFRKYSSGPLSEFRSSKRTDGIGRFPSNRGYRRRRK
jgi:hypothetical protein